MIFSVVTPSLNCRSYIANNLESVRQQGLGDQLEHWVIDGGSTDGTVDLLKNQSDIQWISEPDNGLSDAVNKGILRASGDWIIWLNADDILAPNACRVFLEFAERYPETRVFCGHQTILGYDGEVEQTIEAWDYNLDELLEMRVGVNQASTFVHRTVFDSVGLLDVDNRYAMDYEWVVRAMHHFKCVPIPHVLSYYRRRRGSIMDANMKRQFEEFLRIRRKYARPYLSRAELFMRFYICSDWLRRIRWIRRGVRKLKGMFGQEPLNPM